MARILFFCIIIFLSAYPAYKYIEQEDPDNPKPIEEKPLKKITSDYIQRSREFFRKGHDYFVKNDFVKADSFFSIILKKYGRSPIAEEASLLDAEANIRLNNIEKASWIIDVFVDQYKRSDYLDRCYYLKAYIKTINDDYYAAANNYIKVYSNSPNPELVKNSLNAFNLLAEYKLTYDQILSFKRGFNKKNYAYGNILFFAALKSLVNSDYTKAAKLFNRYIVNYPKHEFIIRAQKYLEKAEHKQELVFRIGILIPQSSLIDYYNDIGKKILNGIKVAVKSYNSSNNVDIKLIVKDTKSDPVTTYAQIKKLIQHDKVSAIIGPLSSDALCVAAAYLKDSSIPLISPTASASGIEYLGQNIFIMSVTKSSMTQKLADYTINKLNIKEYAIIFPNDHYGNVMASSFRNAVEKMGANVIGYDMYERNEKNFAKILERLHEKKVEMIFKEKAIKRGELMGLADERLVEVDSIFMADSSVDIGAIFMPGYDNEIVMLAPQIPFYKIHTKMLGAKGWYDRSVIKHASKYIENALIVVDFINNLKSEEWMRFNGKYKLMFDTKASIKSALGYDAANIVINSLKKDQPNLLTEMQKIRTYRGASGKYVFDKQTHSNKAAIILKIENEQFKVVTP